MLFKELPMGGQLALYCGGPLIVGVLCIVVLGDYWPLVLSCCGVGAILQVFGTKRRS